MKKIKNIILENIQIEGSNNIIHFKESYEGINIVIDYFDDKLIIDERSFIKKFNKVMGELLSYFNNILIFEQLPSQFIFNDEHKKKFLEILPIPKKAIVDKIVEYTHESKRKFGGSVINKRTVEDIFSLTFPYLYLAFRTKDEEFRNNILLMVYTLMYSISYAMFFPKYEYNKDKGEYVIQKVLINKGFAKYESIYDLMTKQAQDTYINYSNRPLSDRVLYEATWSNINAKIKHYLKEYYRAYESVGNKYLSTNKDIVVTTDREGELSAIETNIESDSATINNLTNDVMGYVSNPRYIEDKLLRVVLLKIMNIDTRSVRGNIEKKTLLERNLIRMIENIQETRDFESIIHNIFSNFLWSDKDSKLNVNHIETPMFITKIINDISYIKKSNIYVNKIIEIMDDHIKKILSGNGKKMEDADVKTIQRYRKSIIYYFALLSQLVVKRQ